MTIAYERQASGGVAPVRCHIGTRNFEEAATAYEKFNAGGSGPAVTWASFAFVEDDPLQCDQCTRRLREALQRVPGIEAVSISIEEQWIAIRFNPVLLDSDTLGEKLADLGHVVRPAGKAAAKAW